MGTFGFYFREALKTQLNIVILAGLGIFSLISGSALPILAGLAGEALWLGAAPFTPVFRRFADKRSERFKRLESEAKAKDMLRTLPEVSRSRYRRLLTTAKEIRDNYEQYNESSKSFLEQIEKRLDDILLRYAKMLITSNTYDSYVARVSPEALTTRRDELELELENADDRIREVKSRQKEILEKRIEKAHKAAKDHALLHAQLETFEDIVKLLKEQAITMKDPAEMTGQLDSLVSEIEVTETTVNELENSFSVIFDRELEEAEKKRQLNP